MAAIGVVRRVHEFRGSGALVRLVRWHVVGDDGACIRTLCLRPDRRLCGYPRRKQAADVAGAERRAVSAPW